MDMCDYVVDLSLQRQAFYIK